MKDIAITGNMSNKDELGRRRVPFEAVPEEELVDYHTASFGVERLGQVYDKPFFIACGFHRPHLPLAAPRKYFDMFPLESITLPEVKSDDLADVSDEARRMAKPGEFAAIRDLGKWREHVLAYRACIAFIDAQVGRLLDALDHSPNKDNTIVVLWSDHGWHHGEKEHWRKSTLWEEAIRVPFVVRWPGRFESGEKDNGLVSVRAVARLGLQAAGIDPILPIAPEPNVLVYTTGQEATRGLGRTERDSFKARQVAALRYDGGKLLARGGEAVAWYDLVADPLELLPQPVPEMLLGDAATLAGMVGAPPPRLSEHQRKRLEQLGYLE